MDINPDDFAQIINDNASFANVTISDLGLGSELGMKEEQQMLEPFPQNPGQLSYEQPLQLPLIHQMQLPPHCYAHPTLIPVISKYEFETFVHPDANIIFNDPKLFIKMGSRMTIGLSYRPQVANEELYLRAMILFSKPSEMSLPVKRCANHRTTNISHNDQDIKAHIIKINDPNARYYGDETKEIFAERLSVVVPMASMNYDENGKITRDIALEFHCQNSCSQGINRRPTSIVFTLERQNYELVGKSAIEFKVCSCPKRDAEREKEPKRKPNSNEPFPRGKRPKLMQPQQVKTEPDSESDTNENPNSDNNIATFSTTVVQIAMPTDLVPELFKAAFNIVAGAMAEHKMGGNRPHTTPLLEKMLKDLKKQRKKYELPPQ